MTKNRNADVDIFKFFCSLIILLGHWNTTYKYKYVQGIGILVEFFFIVSGFFMAKAAYTTILLKADESVASQTWNYIFKKFSLIYRYYLVTVFLNVVIYGLTHTLKQTIKACICSLIPTLSLTNMFVRGWETTSLSNNATWYLSALLFVILVMYPLLLKRWSYVSKILFPVLGLVLYGYLMVNYKGNIPSWSKYSVVFYTGVLRAFMAMSIGVSLFAITNEEYHVFFRIPFMRVVLTIIKYSCYVLIVLYVFKFYSVKPYSLVFVEALAVFLSFSGLTYSIQTCRFTEYLGRISLPIYIFHGLMRVNAPKIFSVETMTNSKFWILVTLCAIISVLLMYVSDYLSRWLSNLFKRSY